MKWDETTMLLDKLKERRVTFITDEVYDRYRESAYRQGGLKNGMLKNEFAENGPVKCLVCGEHAKFSVVRHRWDYGLPDRVYCTACLTHTFMDEFVKLPIENESSV